MIDSPGTRWNIWNKIRKALNHGEPLSFEEVSLIDHNEFLFNNT